MVWRGVERVMVAVGFAVRVARGSLILPVLSWVRVGWPGRVAVAVQQMVGVRVRVLRWGAARVAR